VDAPLLLSVVAAAPSVGALIGLALENIVFQMLERVTGLRHFSLFYLDQNGATQ
jgi:hypothetical protein